MQLFHCPACAVPLYFDNDRCTCGQEVAFDPEAQVMAPATRRCANYGTIGCNWLPETGDGLCRSCAMTETVPDLRSPDNLPLWARTEAAKRWMLANLGRWGWFTRADPGDRPVFRLLSEDTEEEGGEPVTMGHAAGVITINVTEANEAVRAERQAQLGELYRTMLGHMRHETAHFLFDRLAARDGFTAAFRPLFGDERADYAESLERHYAAPRDPGATHVTGYATAHPHEDWAESVAHLLHLVEIADSAAAVGLALPSGPPRGYDAYAEADTDRMLNHAIQLSMAVTHVNRALDLPDLYPFVLTDPVREKLGFAHRYLRAPVGA